MSMDDLVEAALQQSAGSEQEPPDESAPTNEFGAPTCALVGFGTGGFVEPPYSSRIP